jgi:DNA-binding transcriptional ArsR family regulator
VSTILEAFSNITRLKIVICLGDKEKNVSELNNNCGLSQSALSQHLMKLRDAGVVTCRKEGREMYYRVVIPELPKLGKELYQIIKLKEEQNHE